MFEFKQHLAVLDESTNNEQHLDFTLVYSLSLDIKTIWKLMRVINYLYFMFYFHSQIVKEVVIIAYVQIFVFKIMLKIS